MKQMQQRLIAAGVLLVLVVGAVLLARSLGEREDTPDEPTPTAEVFTPLFPEQAAALAEVTAVSITETATERTFALEQASGFESDTAEGGAGVTLDWAVVERPDDIEAGLGVDTSRVQQALFSLPTLTPTRQLNEIEGSFSDFGLQPPAYVITFQTDFGQTFTLNVGTQTPTGNGFYVQLPGSDTVNIINTTSIQPVIDFLSNPPIVFPAEEEGEATPEPDA